MFFTATIRVVLLRFSEDEGIEKNIVHLEEDGVGGSEEPIRSHFLSRKKPSPARRTHAIALVREPRCLERRIGRCFLRPAQNSDTHQFVRETVYRVSSTSKISQTPPGTSCNMRVKGGVEHAVHRRCRHCLQARLAKILAAMIRRQSLVTVFEAASLPTSEKKT